VLVPRGVALIHSDGGWQKHEKPWPAEIDPWTHWLHGPDNNAVSSDRRVGISRSLQWTMPPRWTRHHNLPAGFNGLVSGGGKIYYLVDRAPKAVYGPGKWALVARDAFNGMELWQRDIAEWNMEAWGASERYGGRIGRFHGAPDYQAPRRLVAVGDHLFVTLGFHAPVAMLDGDTGEVLDQFEATRGAGEVVVRDDVLYVARNTYDPAPGKEVVAVDVETGKTLWTNGDYLGIAASVGYQKKHTNAFITLGRERLFLVDENDVVALELETGREAWKKPMPLKDEIVGDIDYRYSNFCTLVYHDGAVFFAQIHPGTANMNRWEMKKLQIEARDAATGELLWDFVGGTLAHVTPPDLFVNRGKVWTLDPELKADGDCDARLVGLDCRTGRASTTHHLKSITHGHHHRCYRNKATQRYLLMGEEGIEYVDFQSGESDVHYWLRGACRYGIMPANGFIYVPPHNCGCYLGTLVYGLVALKSRPSFAPAKSADAREANPSGNRMHRGPAFDDRLDPALAAAGDDWPMFRRDAARSCGTSAALPERLSSAWTAEPAGTPTPPVMVGDRVYVGSPDAASVYCLDAADGRVLWRFGVDGPLNAPPTYYRGRLVLGTRTGTLYALRAADGELAWSFGLGPARACISAFGRLESPWPLGGSPLVRDGKVFCVAGRSTSLDTGIYVYKLDLQTGKLLQQVNLQTDTQPKGEFENNSLADMLVGDGEHIYMKSIRFSAADISDYTFAGKSSRSGATRQPKHVLRCQTDMLDESWLNCCFWAYRGCQAQQLVFDDTAAYGVNGPSRVRWGGAFGHDVYRPGTGYSLIKWPVAESQGGQKAGRPKAKRGGSSAKRKKIGIRARSMALAGDRLLLAGTPDVNPADDFWAAYENRKGGVLLEVSRDSGETLAAHKLASEPVYNGIAVAGGRVVLSLRDGTVVSFSGGGEPVKDQP
jgi:outer membrane protein assembly factor BamB